MQTFLPYADPRASAACLDDRRLGKQRVETFQVLRAITWPTYGWKHHPAVRMWRGFVPALVAYGLACVDEWAARGHADSTRAALLEFTGGAEPDWDELHDTGGLPPWVGDEAFHLSHRSALVGKDPQHYRPLFGDIPDDLPYVWPDPTFPRWPVRRGVEEALEVPTRWRSSASTSPTRRRELVERLATGVPTPGSAGLLAGLCTPGTTLWVVDRAALDPVGPAPVPRAGNGSRSPSVARTPSTADRLAMAQEAEAPREFHFVRRELVTRELAEALEAGLVVTPAAADPGPNPARPRLVLP